MGALGEMLELIAKLRAWREGRGRFSGSRELPGQDGLDAGSAGRGLFHRAENMSWRRAGSGLVREAAPAGDSDSGQGLGNARKMAKNAPGAARAKEVLEPDESCFELHVASVRHRTKRHGPEAF